MTLIAVDGNAKTVKGQKYGVITGIMYLSPSDLSGKVNVCPMAEAAGCKEGCLNTAGRGVMSPVQKGRLRKTLYYFNQYEDFMNELVKDILNISNKAKKLDVVPMIRLNGTSDIVWERKGFTLNEKMAKRLGKKAIYYNNLMELFPEVQFYDYTKIAGRFNDKLPKNYDLTFSYSGVQSYAKQVELAVKKGARIAVVFRDDNYPEKFMGMPVVDGDEHDIRPFNPKGSIVGLKAKGKAIKDASGFVVDTVTAQLSQNNAVVS